jgi:hypothetical protein
VPVSPCNPHPLSFRPPLAYCAPRVKFLLRDLPPPVFQFFINSVVQIRCSPIVKLLQGGFNEMYKFYDSGTLNWPSMAV